jgi:dienelactone hydrolase
MSADAEEIALPSAEDGANARLVRSTAEGTAPAAGLLFLHWGFGDRTSFASEAEAYAPRGVTSLLLDAPGFGARRGPRIPARDPAAVRDYAQRLLEELRGGLGLLAKTPGVDAGRLGYVGHSLGATIAPAFLAGESRVRAAALLGGTGTLSRLWLSRRDAAASRALEDLDGVRCLDRVRCALLLQFGDRDEFISAADAAAQTAAAPSSNRHSVTYPCDHAFGSRATRERAAWLGGTLGFEPPPDPVLARVSLPRAQRWKYLALKPLLALSRGAAGEE